MIESTSCMEPASIRADTPPYIVYPFKVPSPWDYRAKPGGRGGRDDRLSVHSRHSKRTDRTQASPSRRMTSPARRRSAPDQHSHQHRPRDLTPSRSRGRSSQTKLDRSGYDDQKPSTDRMKADDFGHSGDTESDRSHRGRDYRGSTTRPTCSNDRYSTGDISSYRYQYDHQWTPNSSRPLHRETSHPGCFPGYSKSSNISKPVFPDQLRSANHRTDVTQHEPGASFATSIQNSRDVRSDEQGGSICQATSSTKGNMKDKPRHRCKYANPTAYTAFGDMNNRSACDRSEYRNGHCSLDMENGAGRFCNSTLGGQENNLLDGWADTGVYNSDDRSRCGTANNAQVCAASYNSRSMEGECAAVDGRVVDKCKGKRQGRDIHPSQLWPRQSDWESIVQVEYMGSFSVIGEDQSARAEYVRKQLLEMKNVNKTKPVLLVISLSGIKVCSDSGESVYMAHALKRISYATCDPELCQFSFLAREPKAHTNMQYCHAFHTKTEQEAEELNAIVGNAFKMAYAYQRQNQTQQPTFNEIIEQQIESQKAEFEEYTIQRQKDLQNRLSQISTTKVDERVRELKERRKKEQDIVQKEQEMQVLQGKDKTTWAKHIAGKARHKSPHVNDVPHTSSPLSPLDTSDSNINQTSVSPFRSISDWREALQSEDSRTYGSPVMTLKEKIDNHYNVQMTLDFKRSSCDGESYQEQQPATSAECDSNMERQSPSGIVNRPLPAPPDVERRPKSKGHKGQRASESFDSTDHMNGSETPKRPVSGRYQNDSPVQCASSHVPADDGNLYQGPPTPLRYDSLKKFDPGELPDDVELKSAPWYQAGIPREIALEILAQEEIGSFVVRDSTTHPSCYALSVKVPKFDNPTGISHYLIMRTQRGTVRLKGVDKEWPTLAALVTHHTVMPEMLPCTLRMPRTANNPAFNDCDKDEKEEDEDYQKLADFSNMMTDLKM